MYSQIFILFFWNPCKLAKNGRRRNFLSEGDPSCRPTSSVVVLDSPRSRSSIHRPMRLRHDNMTDYLGTTTTTTRCAVRGHRRKRKCHSIGLFGILTLILVGLQGGGNVYAAPVAQADTLTSPLIAVSPSPTLTSVSSTVAPLSASETQSSLSSTTSTIPGTVVTDSPLVRTKSLSSQSALPSSLTNQSASLGTPTESISTTVSSAVETRTILPSPTTNADDAPSTSSQEKTYNSLVNFYFLILAGAIAFAILGWWLWRRRRKGKTTRDQRRGLEALRRDLELGRLRRGILGVVGRGNTSGEELPTYPFNLSFVR